MRARRLIPLLLALPVLAGCGGTEFEGVAQSDPLFEGAQIFNERCAGCHTFAAADAEGSAVRVNGSEYEDGRNFNERREQYADVLYAIQNGGYSGALMPENIVVGDEAQKIAEFLAKYSGDIETAAKPVSEPGS